jgi:CheY-like chemotaxis protein
MMCIPHHHRDRFASSELLHSVDARAGLYQSCDKGMAQVMKPKPFHICFLHDGIARGLPFRVGTSPQIFVYVRISHDATPQYASEQIPMMTILVIDNNRGDRHLINTILRHKGYEVPSRRMDRKAWSSFAENTPMVFDLKLEMEGLTVLRHIRSLNPNQRGIIHSEACQRHVIRRPSSTSLPWHHRDGQENQLIRITMRDSTACTQVSRPWVRRFAAEGEVSG